MCGGIEYQDQKIYFPQPDARLPVQLRDGHVTWITWGRRKDEACLASIILAALTTIMMAG